MSPGTVTQTFLRHIHFAIVHIPLLIRYLDRAVLPRWISSDESSVGIARNRELVFKERAGIPYTSADIVMYGQQADYPPPPRVPHRNQQYNHLPPPSLPHVRDPLHQDHHISNTSRLDDTAGRYGQIPLRPPSSLLQPYPATQPRTRNKWATSGGVSLGVLVDDRAWNRHASPSHQSLTSDGEGDRRHPLNHAPSASSYSHDPTPGPSRQSAGAGRVISPIDDSQYNLEATYRSHGPSLPSTLMPIPINRSWTLDSPARSSLAPMEPTHSRRPLTRSPLLLVQTPDFSGSGYSDGFEASSVWQVKDRVGPPPKAKLGGPGGKTYDELRTEDRRVVSAPAGTPPLRSEVELPPEAAATWEEKPGGGSEEEDVKWGNRLVAVRLPAAEASHPMSSSSPPSTSEGARAKSEPKDDFGWSASSPGVGNSGLTALPALEKKIVVAVPQSDGWQKLAAGEMHRSASQIRRTAMDVLALGAIAEGQSGKRDRSTASASPDDPARRHSSNPSISSSSADRLRATALAFVPHRSVSHQPEYDRSIAPTPDRGSAPGRLRPIARPFEPSTYTRRVVTTPDLPGMTAAGAGRLSSRRSVSEYGGEGLANRLRSSAPRFEPRGVDDAPAYQTSGLLAPNPYSTLWLPGGSAGEGASGEVENRDRLDLVPPQTIPTAVTSKTPDAKPPSTPKSTALTVGVPSPSPSSTGMKRTISGKLRPGAPSFVFTFRAPPQPAHPPAASYKINESVTSSESVEQSTRDAPSGGIGNPEMPAQGGQRTPSPASRMHDLPHSGEEHGLGGGEEISEADYASQEEEDEVESFGAGRRRDELRSNAPSPLSNVPRRPDSAQSRPDVTEREWRMEKALLPDQSSGLPGAEGDGRANTDISSLLSGQTALLEQVRSMANSQTSYARDAQAAVEAIRSMKDDLELRKSSEEKKDEVIAALQKQAEDARVAWRLALTERDEMRKRMLELEGACEHARREKEEVTGRLQEAEERCRRAKLRAEEVEAGQMAVLAERDGLAAGLMESFNGQREAEAEVKRLERELELERSKSQLRSSHSESQADRLEALAAENKSFQDELLAEVTRLGQEVGLVAQQENGEVRSLREDKRMLQNEVTELRKKTYEAASKIADADLRLAAASNAASSIEADLRRSLVAAEKAKGAAETKLVELDSGMERLKAENLNLSMMATERSGAMRIMDIRHQALVQENAFWREFALSYDRREHRRYTQSQPFHRSHLPSTEMQAPTQLPTVGAGDETLLTPTNPTFEEGKGTGLGSGKGVEGTPDLSMSMSSSGEGRADVPQPEAGKDGGDGSKGTWWGAEA